MALVKYNNNSISTISSAGQLAQGSLVPIKTLTASSSSTLSFVDGTDGVVLDSTYPIYKFEFINIHLQNAAHFRVNFRDGGSSFDATKTTTYFIAHHSENNADNNLVYIGGKDLAQSTDSAILSQDFYSGGNDSAIVGTLQLFNPSSTTFVKHFIANSQGQFVDSGNPYSVNSFLAGYCNTTSAIDGVQFNTSSGNIDSGTIKLYGIKDS